MRICFWGQLLGILLFSSVYASNVQTINSKTQYVASFNLGPGWYNVGNTQSVLLQPGFTNIYVDNNHTQALITGELFFGIARQLHQHVWGQFGVAGALTSPAHLSGVVWEAGEPHLNNFTYTYDVDHAQISLKGKLLTLVSWYPYISASLGAGFNAAKNYTSTPLLFEILPMSPFMDNDSTSFAYTIGVGIQKALSVHWQLGIGYEFSDWGRSKLGPIAGNTTTNTLQLNHLYVNQLMFNITFLA